MEREKQRRLEAKGWKVGDAADFLDLTHEESMIVEMRLALSRSLKERRKTLMTQAELATKISPNPFLKKTNIPMLGHFPQPFHPRILIRLILRKAHVSSPVTTFSA
jgi:hypothetical protein